MTTTSQLRQIWAPPCQGPHSRVELFGGGVVSVRPEIVDAVKALSKCMEAHGYKSRKADTGAYNCLGGDTLVITRDGWSRIEDLAGLDAELLTTTVGHGGPGRWVTAAIRAFGVQPVFDVVVERNGIQRTIKATADHRWYARPEGGRLREVATTDLQPRQGRSGHRLASCRPQSLASRMAPSAVGIMAGLVYGDGTLDAQNARAYLTGDKDLALAAYFPPQLPRYHWTSDNGVDVVAIGGLPRSWKRSVSLDEGPSFLYGWLAGYFAADGRVTETACCELTSAEEWRLEQARTVALRLGIATSPITSVKRVGYGEEPSMLYSLRLDPRTLDSSFFLLTHHRERWNEDERKAPPDWSVVSVTPAGEAEVYCAEVPDTECFTIEDFVLTGNCRPITGGTEYSLHAFGVALDVNWSSNPYGKVLKTDMPPDMVAAIKAIRTGNGKQVWRWGGDYTGNKDAMHFEVVCTPADLKTGIADLDLEEEDDMAGEGPEILQRIKEIQITQEKQNAQLAELEKKVAELSKK